MAKKNWMEVSAERKRIVARKIQQWKEFRREMPNASGDAMAEFIANITADLTIDERWMFIDGSGLPKPPRYVEKSTRRGSW